MSKRLWSAVIKVLINISLISRQRGNSHWTNLKNFIYKPNQMQMHQVPEQTIKTIWYTLKSSVWNKRNKCRKFKIAMKLWKIEVSELDEEEIIVYYTSHKSKQFLDLTQWIITISLMMSWMISSIKSRKGKTRKKKRKRDLKWNFTER